MARQGGKIDMFATMVLSKRGDGRSDRLGDLRRWCYRGGAQAGSDGRSGGR